MTRSGIQKEVIDLYRRGVRNAMSKPRDQRQAFLTHLRWNFHNPPLSPRDYMAIEHQMRKMDRTLEMLSEPSVKHIVLGDDQKDWWANEIERAHARAAKAAAAKK